MRNREEDTRKHWEMLKPLIPLVRAGIMDCILPSFPRSRIPPKLPSPSSNHAVLMPPHCPMERKGDLNPGYDDHNDLQSEVCQQHCGYIHVKGKQTLVTYFAAGGMLLRAQGSQRQTQECHLSSPAVSLKVVHPFSSCWGKLQGQQLGLITPRLSNFHALS